MRNIFPKLMICLSLVVGCNLDDAEYVLIEELDYAILEEDGSFTKDDGIRAVPLDGGSISFRILANAPVTLAPRGGVPEWAKVNQLSFDGDGVLTVEMQPNTGFRRGVIFDVIMEGSEKELVLTARQDGLTPVLACESPYRSAKGSVASNLEFKVETNLPREQIGLNTTYLSKSDAWLADVDFDGELLVVSTSANAGDVSRKACVELSHTDGWNVVHTLDLYVTQASSEDLFGTPLTFAEARAKASETGVEISDEYTLTGIVISDCRSANMEENPCLPVDMAGEMANTNVLQSTLDIVKQVVDTTASCRTAYMESEDGALGFRLVFDDMQDNILVCGTRLTLSLAGTTLTKEQDPERYTINGLNEENMLESITGVALPSKIRSISELTDADIYTYVGLKNVEFPVKEGSYTDIRENHALWSEVNDLTVPLADTKRYFYMDGYANLLVDSEGKAICTPINMLCRWRKPSAGIPQGSGTAYGIIVHNELKRYGDPGRYQLRAVDESGFAALESPSLWNLITGWDRGKLTPSQGDLSAVMVCEKPGVNVKDEHSYKSIDAATKKTCGISDTFRSIHISSPVSDWYDWKDGEAVSYNGMRMEFSTAGLSGTEVMVVFRFYAGKTGTSSTFQAYPSHWCVEYSLDGKEYKPARNADLSGKDYVHLRNIAFTAIALGSTTTTTTTSSSLGPSAHAFCLPAEVLGKEKVMVRIRPYDTVLSAVPSLFTDEIENSHAVEQSKVTDYISFQDIFIRYR